MKPTGSSPKGASHTLFQLVQLTLQALFPEMGFHLRQVVLFHCYQYSHLAIGESIGSLLCSAYISSGGVNVDQAGVKLGKNEL